MLLLAGGPPLMAAVALGLSQVIFGFIGPLWDVNSMSLRQSATPPHLQGRVSAATSFIGVGTAPVGALLAGWIGEWAGLRMALLETTIITILALAVLVRSSVPRLRSASGYLAERSAEVSQVLG